jgi:hypothetical protein
MPRDLGVSRGRQGQAGDQYASEYSSTQVSPPSRSRRGSGDRSTLRRALQPASSRPGSDNPVVVAFQRPNRLEPKPRQSYAGATSALVPRWRAYMASTHLNPGWSLSESRNCRDWALRSSGWSLM